MDPFIGQVMTKVVTDVAAGGSGSKAVTMPQSGAASFAEVMNALGGKEESGQMLQPGDMTGGAQFESIAAGDLEPAPGSFAISEATPAQGMSAVVDMLQDVNQSQMKMDQFYASLLDGNKQYSMQEMLLIQAKIYQLAQVTEMCVKVTQEGVSSIKTTLNTQVQ